jgi:hypothetical protein
MQLKVSGDLDGTILHIAGEEIVVDEYDDDPAKRVKAMAVLLTHHNQWTAKLHTLDNQRVNQAWEYIYSHGCTGHKNSF